MKFYWEPRARSKYLKRFHEIFQRIKQAIDKNGIATFVFPMIISIIAVLVLIWLWLYPTSDTAACFQTVEYVSSEWELLWLNNIELWQQNQSIFCQQMIEQKDYLHTFMRGTCSSEIQKGWCEINDSVHRFWYNIETLELTTKQPEGVSFTKVFERIQNTPSNSTIWSHFIRRDECTGTETN